MNNSKSIPTIVILLLLFLFGCGQKGNSTENRITLVFWHSFVSSTIPALNHLIERFQEEYANIHVRSQYVPTGDALIQKLVTAIQTQTAPDIAWIHSDFLDKLVEADAIYRMDEFINGPNGLSEEELGDIFPALLQGAKWCDTVYAMPMEATSLALIYNRDLFRKVGLDPGRPPRNWEELYEYSLKLTEDTNGDGKTDQWGFYVPAFSASGPLSIWMVLQWIPFLWQAGGEEINREQTEVLFNSEAGVEALTLWKRLYDDLDMKSFYLAHDLGFASQRLAMVLDGPWNLPEYRKLQEVEWSVAPLPAGPVGRATYLAGEHLAVFKQTLHPEEAWTFIKWIIRPENQARFSIESGYLPVRKSVLQMDSYQEYLETDPALKAFLDQLTDSRGRMPIDYHRVEINQNLAMAIEKALRSSYDIKVCLDEAAAKSNKLLRSLGQ